MTTKKKVDLHWVHRHAGLTAQFMAQDEGEIAELNSTTILGQVPGKGTWIVECDFTATDEVADGEYWWPMEKYLAVYRQENGEPISRHATDEEIALCVAFPQGLPAER